MGWLLLGTTGILFWIIPSIARNEMLIPLEREALRNSRVALDEWEVGVDEYEVAVSEVKVAVDEWEVAQHDRRMTLHDRELSQSKFQHVLHKTHKSDDVKIKVKAVAEAEKALRKARNEHVKAIKKCGEARIEAHRLIGKVRRVEEKSRRAEKKYCRVEEKTDSVFALRKQSLWFPKNSVSKAGQGTKTSAEPPRPQNKTTARFFAEQQSMTASDESDLPELLQHYFTSGSNF